MTYGRFIHVLCTFGYILTMDSCMSVTSYPSKPALGNSLTVTCQRSSSSSAAIMWYVGKSILTACAGSKNDSCVPSPTGYTYSTDVSANQFNLTIATTKITDCKTYACSEVDNETDPISEKIVLAAYSQNDISPKEPGANTNGSISITTGCVLSSDDLTITWSKIVNGKSVALSASDPSPVNSTDRSTCNRTCHTEEDRKVTSGFTHTEYTGSDSETVRYMVTVSHSSYPDKADIYTWTSENYNLKQATVLSPDVSSTSTSTTATFITTAATSSTTPSILPSVTSTHYVSSSTSTNTNSTADIKSGGPEKSGKNNPEIMVFWLVGGLFSVEIVLSLFL